MAKQVSLTFPDFSPNAASLELSVDASDTGTGACLTQLQGGDQRIISYASTTFSPAQRNYSATERELCGLRWAVQHYKTFLYGRFFLLNTDHKPLVYLENMKMVDSRLARTLEDLSEFSFQIRYLPGKENVLADAMSRVAGSPVDLPNIEPSDGIPNGTQLLQRVNGGGDSLFESLFILLSRIRTQRKVPLSHHQLRRELIDELLSNLPKYRGAASKKDVKAIKAMANPGVFPLNEVILVAAHLYAVRIMVHYGTATTVAYVPDPTVEPEEFNQLHLQCISGIHFNPLVADSPVQVHNLVFERLRSGQGGTPPSSQQISPARAPIDDSDDDLQACLFFDRVDQAPTPTPSDVPTCGHPDSRLCWTWLNVAGLNLCSGLDSGAQISLITAAALDRIRRTPGSQHRSTPVAVRLKAVGGNVTPITEVAHVSIQINGSQFEFPFAVVPTEAIPFCFLLGLNYLQARGSELDFEKAQLADSATIHGYSVEVFACEAFPDDPIPVQELHDLQANDAQLARVKKAVETGQWPAKLKSFRRHRSQLKISNGIIRYQGRLVVSYRALVHLVVTYHHTLAHIGTFKLTAAMSAYWHPALTKVIKDVCRSCQRCQLYKTSQQSIVPPTVKITTSHPFELVALDCISLPRTRRGHNGCLVMVDHHSKWVSMEPVKNKEASTIARVLEDRILPTLPWTPLRILTDNGPEFRSTTFEDLLEKYGIKHSLSSPYKPACNGAVERVNRTMSEFLRSLSRNSTHWDQDLTRARITYNNTKHSEIGMTPAEKLMTESHRTRNIIPVSLDTWKKGHPNFVPFKVGQRVLRKIVTTDRSVSRKFAPKFEGPFDVVKVFSRGVSYETRDPETGAVRQAHHTHLKAWHHPPKYLQEYHAQVPVPPEQYPQQPDADSDPLLEIHVMTPKKTVRTVGTQTPPVVVRPLSASPTKVVRVTTQKQPGQRKRSIPGAAPGLSRAPKPKPTDTRRATISTLRPSRTRVKPERYGVVTDSQTIR